jgi:hypothetical protein
MLFIIVARDHAYNLQKQRLDKKTWKYGTIKKPTNPVPTKASEAELLPNIQALAGSSLSLVIMEEYVALFL